MTIRSEREIIDSWESDRPLVSIICPTYNHSKFIGDAIAGFLSQRTTFPIEVIINDDASTDGTANILQNYSREYPNIINIIIQNENQYSKGRVPTLMCMQRARGEYFAFCEGDDYWTCDHKLQLQVDFLERNPEFSMSAHPANILDETEFTSSYQPYARAKKKINYFKDILHQHFIPTLSLVIRKNMLPDEMPGFLSYIRSRDVAYELMLADRGPCLYMEDVMGTYRHHDHGITKQKEDPFIWRKKAYALYMGIDEYTQGRWHKDIRKRLAVVDYSTAKLLGGDKLQSKRWKYLLLAIRKDPLVLFRQIFRKILE